MKTPLRRCSNDCRREDRYASVECSLTGPSFGQYLRGMHRSQFYEFKRRFQTHGLEGLKDLLPIPKSHPMTDQPPIIVPHSKLLNHGPAELPQVQEVGNSTHCEV